MSLTEKLRLLWIAHYVVGGIYALFANVGLIHVAIGISFLVAPQAWESPGQSGPPPWFGLVFLVAGGIVVVMGWTLGILTILSGRAIAKRKRRTFSIIMAGINCALVPLGTVLGILTLLVLVRDDAAEAYGIEKPLPPQ